MTNLFKIINKKKNIFSFRKINQNNIYICITLKIFGLLYYYKEFLLSLIVASFFFYIF